MSEISQQKILISSWVDGECSPDEIRQCIEAVKTNAALHRYWKCCHTVRGIVLDVPIDSLNGRQSQSLDRRVQLSLEALPAHSGAKKSTASIAFINTRLLVKKVLRPNRYLKKIRWVQTAVAASMATLAIVLLDTGGFSPSPIEPVELFSKATVPMPVQSLASQPVPRSNPVVVSRANEPLMTLGKRIAIDSDGNMHLLGLPDNAVDIGHVQRNARHLYIERVNY